jgi:RND family efflux transporter MFP subunit
MIRIGVKEMILGQAKYILSAASAIILTACVPDEPEPKDAPVRPVKVFEITASSDIRTLRLPAVMRAAESSVIAFQVGGLLQEITLVEGQDVKRGDELARLDQRDFVNAVASAQAQYDNAHSEFERARRLVEQNAISRSVYEQRKAQSDIARARLRSAEKALSDTVLTAPFDGVVADLHVEPFETIAPQQPIVTIQNNNAIEAIVHIPATIVANADRIDPIEIIVILDAAPDVFIPAVLSEAVSVADPSTQTFEAKFSFAPPDGLQVLPGMTGVVRGQFRFGGDDVADRQVTVPISAVISEAGKTYVWVLDTTSMRVFRRDIEVSTGVGEMLVVEEGLEAGDIIVAAGGQYLYEGAEVRLYER